MENELIEKIASLEDSVSKLQAGIGLLLILCAVGFIGICLLFGFINSTLRLRDHDYCLFDSLPFWVRFKVLRNLEKDIKPDIDAYVDQFKK